MSTKEPKPLSLDAQAEIVTAVETDASLTVCEVDADVRKFRDQVLCADMLDVTPWETCNREIWRKRYAQHLAVPSAPISKAEDWQARDVWSERVVVWSIVAMMIGLGLACLLGRGVP